MPKAIVYNGDQPLFVTQISGEPAKNMRGAKCLTSGDQQYFCLALHFPNHKMDRCAKNFGRRPSGPRLATSIAQIRAGARSYSPPT